MLVGISMEEFFTVARHQNLFTCLTREWVKKNKIFLSNFSREQDMFSSISY